MKKLLLVLALLPLFALTGSETTAAAQSWIADRNNAEQALNKNDPASARAQLAVSLTKVSKLPPPAKKDAIEPQISRLNADFVRLWVLELQQVLAKANVTPASSESIRNDYYKTMQNDYQVLLAISEKQLGKDTAVLGQTRQSFASLSQILKQPAFSPASEAMPAPPGARP